MYFSIYRSYENVNLIKEDKVVDWRSFRKVGRQYCNLNHTYILFGFIRKQPDTFKVKENQFDLVASSDNPLVSDIKEQDYFFKEQDAKGHHFLNYHNSVSRDINLSSYSTHFVAIRLRLQPHNLLSSQWYIM